MHCVLYEFYVNSKKKKKKIIYHKKYLIKKIKQNIKTLLFCVYLRPVTESEAKIDSEGNSEVMFPYESVSLLALTTYYDFLVTITNLFSKSLVL